MKRVLSMTELHDLFGLDRRTIEKAVLPIITWVGGRRKVEVSRLSDHLDVPQYWFTQQWFDRAGAAKELGCSEASITKYIGSGQLKALRIGKRYAICDIAIKKYLQDRLLIKEHSEEPCQPANH